jgi:peptidoglycan/xylan/chitin deacetylase (PgdA/CDA1 family)
MISKASIITPILVIMLAVTTILSSNSITTTNSYGYSPCNCVIFVMDDMADHGSNSVQLATMDYFISKNMPFTPSIVIADIGNTTNSRVLNKVKEGVDKQLFEIAIHGYRHLNHSLLTKEVQVNDFIKANERLEILFGKRSDIFVPPFDDFNLHTIEAMGELNISLISTSRYKEAIVTNPYRSQTLDEIETNNSKIGVSRISDQGSLVYHAPYTVSILYLHKNGLFGDDLVHEALRLIDDSIAKYGFAQVRLHPTDFAQVDPTTGTVNAEGVRIPKVINEVDDIKFQELTRIVDNLVARNIRIASLAEIYPYSYPYS